MAHWFRGQGGFDGQRARERALDAGSGVNPSLVAWPVVAGFAAATVLLVGLSIRARSGYRRRTAIGSALVALLLTAGAGVNLYFSYYPTVDTLFGLRARDQASALEIRHIQRLQRIPHPKPLQRGLVEEVAIPAPTSHFRSRPAQVYLPPAWFQNPRPALPVILLLHGTPGMPADWTRAGLADITADDFALHHEGLAPIIIMADQNGGFLNDTECVDGRGGRAETFLVDDVHAWAVAQLGASPEAARWAVAGGSEGGFCALDLGLRHPDRFTAFADFGGLDRPTHADGALRLLRGSRVALHAHQPRRILRSPESAAAVKGMGAWFEVGGDDGGTTRAVLGTARLAAAAGLDTHVTVLPGAHHTWRVWHRSFADAFPWLCRRLGLPA